MKIYEYDNYEEYVKAQVNGNIRKLKNLPNNKSYAEPETLEKICNYKPDAKKILCHGTRNAREQKIFKKLLKQAYVIGSEISPTASQFEMTVQHDFNKIREEWINSFDIVYSNSIDHSITPLETLGIWADQLTDNGLLFLEHSMSENINICDETDPLQISKNELIELLRNNHMEVIEQFKSKKNNGYVLVCRKK